MNGPILYRPERVGLDRPGMQDKDHPPHLVVGYQHLHHRPMIENAASCTGVGMCTSQQWC